MKPPLTEAQSFHFKTGMHFFSTGNSILWEKVMQVSQLHVLLYLELASCLTYILQRLKKQGYLKLNLVSKSDLLKV